MAGKMDKILGIVMTLVVGLLLVAFLVPLAFDEMYTANTTSWSDSVADIWELLPVIGAIVLILVFIGLAMRSYR